MDSTLTLSQMFSPSFPVGAFAYSQGLEQAIADGHVSDAGELSAWLGDLVALGTGRADAVAIRCAAAAGPDEIAAVDEAVRAFVPAVERVRETDEQGAAFGRTAAAIWGVADGARAYPVAVGAACRALDLPVEAAILHHLNALVSNVVAAAQRLMPLGQVAAQGVIAGLHPTCEAVVAETRGATLDDLASATFLGDIAAMRHETLEPRIFRS